jgi:hypothetical protein
MDEIKKLELLKLKVQAEKDAMYREDSKSRLKKIATQKIRTTMIGALSTIEKKFGFLWGLDENGRDKNGELTSEEQELREIFDSIRSEILDLGNNQIRNLDTELSQYDVKWNRFHMTLPVKDIQESKEE